MMFAPTAFCLYCDEPIMLMTGVWVDETINNPIVDPSFAAMCETGDRHRPKDDE